MAAKISICRLSSQDPLHRTDNILSKGKKWLCHKDDKSGRLEAELHLPKSIKIGFINLGNCGSAFVEILVGRSMWPSGKDYVTLLPSTMLMSPADSKSARRKEGVKMFNRDSFVKGVPDDDWDRLRVILRQPYTKNKQFGLQFIDIIADDKLTNNETSHESDKSKTSPKQSLAVFRSKLQAISSPSSSHSQPQRPPSMGHLTSPTSSRAAGLVQAALKGHVKPKQQEKGHQRHKVKRNSPYQVDAQLQRRKSASRRTAGDIEDEVECFLESFDFDKLPLESITYRHLKEQMEQMRGCKLNKEERKIFLRLAKKHVISKIDLQEENGENVIEPEEVKNTEDGEESIPKSPAPPSRSPATPPFKSPTQSSSLTTNSLHECPLCEKFFPPETIEFHASTCVGATTRETIVLTSPTRECDAEEVEMQQVHSPVKTAYDLGSSETVRCPVCNCWFPESRINVHANICAESGLLMSF